MRDRRLDVAAEVALAEVEVADDPPDELAVLHDDGPVDAQLVVRRLDLRLGRMRIEDDRPPRLGGDQPEQDECHPRKREHEQHSGENAADDVGGHRSFAPGSKARRTPSPKRLKASTVSAIAIAGQAVVHTDGTSPIVFGSSTMKKWPQFVASMFP